MEFSRVLIGALAYLLVLVIMVIMLISGNIRKK